MRFLAINFFTLSLLLFSFFLYQTNPLIAGNSNRVGAFALPNSPWDIQWSRFRANVEKSGLELEYFIRGELGSEEQMLSALKRNRLQIAGASLQGISSIVPALNVALSPFIFETSGHVDFVYDTVLLDVVNKLLVPHNLVLLRWLESGWFSIASREPIVSPNDLAGQKIGGSPNAAIQNLLQGFGADAIPIASINLAAGLDTHLIDGVIKPTALIYANLRKSISYITLFNISYDTGGLLVNKSWFDNLSTMHKIALKSGHGSSRLVRQEVRSLVSEQIGLMNIHGPKVQKLTDTDLMLWKRKGLAMHQSIIDVSGKNAELVYNSIREAINEYDSIHY